MLFNSIEFAIFLPIVFILYWFTFQQRLRVQNFYLLIVSYVFYGWWDWRFLILIIFSSTVDFLVGKTLGATENKKRRKSLLVLSMVVNLGLLGYFKYYNFFAESLADAFTLLGKPLDPKRLAIVLPVGISFYTFQTMSYTIDVYRRRLLPTRNAIDFFAFVSFFPQLVAGPIERATNLLPQFYKKRTFSLSKASNGLRQILWGLFKKVVIADNCAKFANIIFSDYSEFSGSTLFLGGIFFAFQIYGDFSGYSDIAIGTARLFGFNLMQNFAFPYFSRDIAEFWRRWHISLSTWFRDYVYIPLGGSRGGNWMKIRNTFIIFIVSGLWHGANWTFVIWGALNAFYFLPLLLLNKNRTNLGVVAQKTVFPTFKELCTMLITFVLTVLAWIFFRSDSVGQAYRILSDIFSESFLQVPHFGNSKSTIFLMIIFLLIEWLGRRDAFALENFVLDWKRPIRLLFYYSLIAVIFIFGVEEQQFIYFQF